MLRTVHVRRPAGLTPTTLGTNAFRGTILASIMVPDLYSIQVYKAAPNWSAFAGIITALEAMPPLYMLVTDSPRNFIIPPFLECCPFKLTLLINPQLHSAGTIAGFIAGFLLEEMTGIVFYVRSTQFSLMINEITAIIRSWNWVCPNFSIRVYSNIFEWIWPLNDEL